MTVTGCHSCDQEANFDGLPPRELIASDEHWRVVHAFNSGLLGWLVLTTRRHVMELAELNDAEVATLGAWQVRLARALGEEFGTSKTYVAEFGEVSGFHLHFHVVPRLGDLDDAMRGPGIFSFLGVSDDEQVSAEARDDLAKRLAARLTA
ncbi:HIT family protein [Actinopolymorpha alba]|uniref:HIT family protein n=1 Tax=Actinopolymorpha alba TaxID=533267 RepID=UPI0003667A01|nr:HIT family protein [Actinopolymorpha alba]